MKSSSGDRHLTSLDFDRLAMVAGTSKGTLAQAEHHLADCALCSARRDEHAAMIEHFRSRVFPRTAPRLSLTGERRGLGQKWRNLLLGLALPSVAVIPLLFRSLPSGQTPSPAPTLSPIGVKGNAAFHVFARLGGPQAESPGTVVQVVDGTKLAAGDALRFVLDPTGLPYVLIASVDGAGQVSIYYPFTGERSARVEQAVTVSVPDSIVLDRAPGPERLFALFSREPILSSDVRQVLANIAAGGTSAIRATQQLPLEGAVQATVLFEKASAP